MASGTLAPFALISIGEDIEIMVANPALENGFMQIMVKYYRALIVLAEFSAFKTLIKWGIS